MNKKDIGSDAKSFVDLMDMDELIRLHKYIAKRIRFLSDTRTMERVQGFELLEKVYFFDDRGDRIDGTIIRLNKKTVTIKTEDGTEWRVSPHFLKIRP